MDPAEGNLPPSGSEDRPPSTDNLSCFANHGDPLSQLREQPDIRTETGLTADFAIAKNETLRSYSSCSSHLLSHQEQTQRSTGHSPTAPMPSGWPNVAPKRPDAATSLDYPVILCIPPASRGGRQRFIYLDPTERIHQDALLVYFESAGREVFALPCPDFTIFLGAHFLMERDVSFVTNLPAYIINSGRRLLAQNKLSYEASPRLSWLPVGHPSSILSRLNYGPSRPRRQQHFTDVTRQCSGLTETHSATPHNRLDPPDGYDLVGPLPPPPI
jgi:hypothetical protein